MIFDREKFFRIIAAIIGGYIFSNVMSLLLFFVCVDNSLIDRQSEVVNSAAIQSIFNSMSAIGISSYAIYTAAILWVFHACSVTHAWFGMLMPSFVGVGVIYILLPPAIQGLF